MKHYDAAVAILDCTGGKVKANKKIVTKDDKNILCNLQRIAEA